MARTRARSGSRRGRHGRNSPHIGGLEFFVRPEQYALWQVLGLLVRIRAELFIATTLLVIYILLLVWLTPDPVPQSGPGQALAATATVAGVPLVTIGTTLVQLTVPELRWLSWLPLPPATPESTELVEPWQAVFTPSNTALMIMTGTLLVLVAIPASRRYLIRRTWCVITRHRMRSCFVQTHTMNHNGRTPFLLWSRPSPVGERVRVWLPAGLSVKDLEDDAGRLAAACWAHQVRVTPTRHQAALVVVDIVRRDPLSTQTVLQTTVLDNIDNNIDDNIDNQPDTAGGAVVPLPDRATLRAVPDIDSPAADNPAGSANNKSPRNTRKTPASTSTSTAAGTDDSEPTVTGFGGVDVSDYV